MNWRQTLFKSKGIYPILIAVATRTLSIVVNAVILTWISKSVSNYNNPMESILVVVTLCVVDIGLSATIRFCGGISSHLIYTELYKRVMNKVIYSDYNLFTKFSPSEIITTTDHMWNIARVPSMAVQISGCVINFIVNAMAIIIIDKRLLLPILIVYPVGGILLWKTYRIWEKIDSEIDKVKRSRNKELDDVINGFQEVRSFPEADNRHFRSISEKHIKTLDLLVHRCRTDAGISCIITTIDGLTTTVALVYVVTALQNGLLTEQATGISLVMYAWRLLDPMIAFIDVVSGFSEMTANIPNYQKLMSYEDTVHSGNIELESFDGQIEINEVSFAYEKSSTVLDNVNLTIRKGEHVGICGPSGGGKSTLLKLIPRFYDPDKGSIKIDGIDLKDLTKESIRKHIGVVHQNPFIFNGTIYDNILYANPEANRYQVIEACKKADLYDFIVSLKDGFDTEVGARGLKLSGGQKQRISIARIFLNDPDIIILDEATSALDNTTESFIQESLDTVFRNKTQIVVAHRLSTIKDSDKIVVIANHHIEEAGTHEELMNAEGIYASMCK